MGISRIEDEDRGYGVYVDISRIKDMGYGVDISRLFACCGVGLDGCVTYSW